MIIPSTITYIGDGAFYKCSQLKNISIPTSVVATGAFVFQKCSKIASLAIPSSMNTINEAFCAYCTNLMTVSIPTSILRIRKFAFYYSSSLTTLNIPAYVTSIGDYAWQGCSSLSGAINIPSTLSVIGLQIFQYNRRISFNIPAAISAVVYPALLDCSLFQVITVPDTVTTIKNSSFFNCSDTLVVNVPTTVKTIGDYAFANCERVLCVRGSSAGAPGVSPVAFLNTATNNLLCPTPLPTWRPTAKPSARPTGTPSRPPRSARPTSLMPTSSPVPLPICQFGAYCGWNGDCAPGNKCSGMYVCMYVCTIMPYNSVDLCSYQYPQSAVPSTPSAWPILPPTR